MDISINEADLESLLSTHKMPVNSLESQELEHIGSSNFAVFKYRLGLEKFAVKSIPFRDQHVPRKQVLDEMHMLLKCGGSSNVLRFVGWVEELSEPDGIPQSIQIVMQYCEGGTLASWISNDVARSRDVLFNMLKGIVSGIWYIHFKGIIHNDIKPDNILISKDTPYVSDFGSATLPGCKIYGTAGFMCPESVKADEKSDAYGMGVTLHQLYSRKMRKPSDPFKFDISPDAINDSRVREILEVLLVARAKRMTVRQIVAEFPGTSTINVTTMSQETSVPTSLESCGTLNNSSLSQPAGPSKLSQFPQIQAYWRDHFISNTTTSSSNDDGVPLKQFLDTLRLTLPRNISNLLRRDAPDLRRLSQLLVDEDDPTTVTPMSLGLLLLEFPDTEQDTMAAALLKIFDHLRRQSEDSHHQQQPQSQESHHHHHHQQHVQSQEQLQQKQLPIPPRKDSSVPARGVLLAAPVQHRPLHPLPEPTLLDKAMAGDRHACLLAAGQLAAGTLPNSPKDLARAAALLSQGLGIPGIQPADFTEASTVREDWDGSKCVEIKTVPVTVDEAGRITSIILRVRKIVGVIPTSLSCLENLTHLVLYCNKFSGNIPKELGLLKSLQKLIMSSNQLTGSIPAEIGQLSELQHLSFHTNNLSGSIPREIGQLVRLERLYLYNNQLTGSIPEDLGKLKLLRRLNVGNNRLTGVVPQSVKALPNCLKSFEGNKDLKL